MGDLIQFPVRHREKILQQYYGDVMQITFMGLAKQKYLDDLPHLWLERSPVAAALGISVGRLYQLENATYAKIPKPIYRGRRVYYDSTLFVCCAIESVAFFLACKPYSDRSADELFDISRTAGAMFWCWSTRWPEHLAWPMRNPWEFLQVQVIPAIDPWRTAIDASLREYYGS